jgi:hypothetical protein
VEKPGQFRAEINSVMQSHLDFAHSCWADPVVIGRYGA